MLEMENTRLQSGFLNIHGCQRDSSSKIEKILLSMKKQLKTKITYFEWKWEYMRWASKNERENIPKVSTIIESICRIFFLLYLSLFSLCINFSFLITPTLSFDSQKNTCIWIQCVCVYVCSSEKSFQESNGKQFYRKEENANVLSERKIVLSFDYYAPWVSHIKNACNVLLLLGYRTKKFVVILHISAHVREYHPTFLSSSSDIFLFFLYVFDNFPYLWNFCFLYSEVVDWPFYISFKSL